jgi:hypothetical protein
VYASLVLGSIGGGLRAEEFSAASRGAEGLIVQEAQSGGGAAALGHGERADPGNPGEGGGGQGGTGMIALAQVLSTLNRKL